MIGECVHHIPVINITEPDADTSSKHVINLYCAHCDILKAPQFYANGILILATWWPMIQECSHLNLRYTSNTGISSKRNDQHDIS
jgi:hypothetical protein